MTFLQTTETLHVGDISACCIALCSALVKCDVELLPKHALFIRVRELGMIWMLATITSTVLQTMWNFDVRR